jgi:type III pantothenate kinase
MLLAIDIGNSSIKFGIFDGGQLVHKFNIATKHDYTADELVFDRFHVLDDQFIQLKFATVIIASVVPALNGVIAETCFKLFKVNAVFVDSSLDIGMKIIYDPPSAAGADRIVNAFSAIQKYGVPLIVCSFGTATTMDVVSDNGDYVGGLIAPGMGTMAEALHLKTAKLPAVRITKPEAVIRNSTAGSIESGVFYGHIAMVEGLIERIRVEYRFRFSGDSIIVFTGGFANLIAEAVDDRYCAIVDENLTLDGLRMIAGHIGLPQ